MRKKFKLQKRFLGEINEKTNIVKFNCSYCGGFELERTKQKTKYSSLTYSSGSLNYTALHIKITDEKTKKEDNIQVCPICLVESIGTNLPFGFFSNPTTIKTTIKLLDSILGPRKKIADKKEENLYENRKRTLKRT